MTAFRLGRNTTEHYSSFEEMGRCWGCKSVSKVTKDKKKLESQREKFSAKHRCKACGEFMVYISGTSVMSCKNEKCKGIKNVRLDKEGNEIITYTPSYDLLDELGSTIAENIYANK